MTFREESIEYHLFIEGGIRKMIDPKTEQKATEWTDEIPDPEEERPDPYEETYRDGSARNECWASED